MWWARKDLNLGPMDYESTALTAELRARFHLNSTILQHLIRRNSAIGALEPGGPAKLHLIPLNSPSYKKMDHDLRADGQVAVGRQILQDACVGRSSL